MKHTIELNIKELIALGKPKEIKNLVESVITDEFTEKQYNDLIAELLDDHLGYLLNEDFEHSKEEQEIKNSICKVIIYFKGLK